MRHRLLGLLVVSFLAGGLAAPDLQAQAICTITCPANMTQSNDPNQCGAVVTYPPPTTTGTCGTVTASPASGSFFPVGTTTVTVTTTAGPSCTFTVTVVDTQPPTNTCPANITVSNAPNQCGAVVNYPATTATDNCPGVTVVASPPSGSFFPVGTTTVTRTATDAAGNTATCTFTVTANDTQPPTITCPANQSVLATGPSGAVVNFNPPSKSDNCPGVTAICTPASGSTFAIGTTPVQCTATDSAGNTAICSFNVTVTNPPVIPTLSQWMLLLLGVILAVTGVVATKLR
jgi:HYR domain